MTRAVGLFLQGMGVLALVVVVAGVWFVFSAADGFGARSKPSAVEALIARRVRLASIPARARSVTNPVVDDAAARAAAKAHYADHCAICHAADGSGVTPIGSALYPPAPDMRDERTQSLTDGEIFFIIENGIRFTGMPGWGHAESGNADDSWQLVHLIRRLPGFTADDVDALRSMMPRSSHAHENGADHHAPKPGVAGHHHNEPEAAPHSHGADAS